MNNLKICGHYNREIDLNSMGLKLEVIERAHSYYEARDIYNMIQRELRELFHYVFHSHSLIKLKGSISISDDEHLAVPEFYLINIEAKSEVPSNEELLNQFVHNCKNLPFHTTLIYYFTVSNKRETLLGLEQEAYRNTIDINRHIMQRDNINPIDVDIVSYPIELIQTEEFRIPLINGVQDYIPVHFVPHMVAEISCCILYRI